MKIAEVSKEYGLSADTLRYYERIGLLRHVPRNKSGIRDYDEASCNAVEFVKCMRDAGMSIESLVEYMELLEQGDETTAARKELLLRQGDEIRERIAAGCRDSRELGLDPRCSPIFCRTASMAAMFGTGSMTRKSSWKQPAVWKSRGGSSIR